MFSSDPVMSVSGQIGQWGQTETWMYNSPDRYLTVKTAKYLPTGRLKLAPRCFWVNPEWTSFDPDNEPIVPRPDELLLFTDQYLSRQMIDQAVPPSTWHFQYLPFPEFAYTCPHWLSPLTNDNPNPGDGTDHDLINIRWGLYYGDSSSFRAISAPYDQTNLNYSLYDEVDSRGFPSDNQFDSPVGWQGWILILFRRIFVLPTISTNPVIIRFSCYGAWNLRQPDPPDTTQLLFSPETTSDWYIFHNPLNFPPHILHLEPQPEFE